MSRRKSKQWDIFDIKAEISRRGFNQTQLALRLDIDPSRFRAVWNRTDRPVEQKIHEWINEEVEVSLECLWPDRYPIPTTRGYDSRRNGPSRSQKSTTSADKERAA